MGQGEYLDRVSSGYTCRTVIAHLLRQHLHHGDPRGCPKTPLSISPSFENCRASAHNYGIPHKVGPMCAGWDPICGPKAAMSTGPSCFFPGPFYAFSSRSHGIRCSCRVGWNSPLPSRLMGIFGWEAMPNRDRGYEADGRRRLTRRHCGEQLGSSCRNLARGNLRRVRGICRS